MPVALILGGRNPIASVAEFLFGVRSQSGAIVIQTVLSDQAPMHKRVGRIARQTPPAATIKAIEG